MKGRKLLQAASMMWMPKPIMYFIELEVIAQSQCSQAGSCSNADTAEQSRRQVAQIDFCVQTGLFSVTQ